MCVLVLFFDIVGVNLMIIFLVEVLIVMVCFFVVFVIFDGFTFIARSTLSFVGGVIFLIIFDCCIDGGFGVNILVFGVFDINFLILDFFLVLIFINKNLIDFILLFVFV